MKTNMTTFHPKMEKLIHSSADMSAVDRSTVLWPSCPHQFRYVLQRFPFLFIQLTFLGRNFFQFLLSFMETCHTFLVL